MRRTAVLMLCYLLVSVSSASAVTITLGPSDLGAADPFASCGLECTTRTYIPVAVPGARLATPTDGTIVSWRVKGAPPKRLRLRIVRAVADGTFHGVDTSGSATISDGIGSVPAAIGIKAGDQIGIDLETESPSVAPSKLLGSAGFPGASWSGYSPRLSDGITASPSETGVEAIPMFNATVALARPHISNLSSVAGPESGGEIVVVTGEHLAELHSLSFDGARAEVIKADNVQVIAVTPPHPPGPVDVFATTAAGTSPAVGAARYSYLPLAGPGRKDLIRPQIRRLKLVPGALRPRQKAKVFYRASEPVRVWFRVQRRRGRRYQLIGEALFSRQGGAGKNTVTLPGKVTRVLAAGRYRLVVRARDAAGNPSIVRRIRFVVRRDR